MKTGRLAVLLIKHEAELCPVRLRRQAAARRQAGRQAAPREGERPRF